MRSKVLIFIFALLISFSASAYVIQGTATVPVLDGNIAKADTDARQQAMLSALKNYFNILKSSQPNTEIPDVTTEFFKFIKSYKIADREYNDDNVTYTILADVDDVALNDLMYFVKHIVNTIVYNITGADMDVDLDSRIASALKEYKFDTKYESDFQANLKDNSTPEERKAAFKAGQSQYFLDMSALREPAPEGQCTIILTTKTFSKTKEFKILKTKSSSTANNESDCVKNAVALSLVKTLSYVRENFIPLPKTEKVMKTFSVTAENYRNFAVPKKLMDELKSRSFINSYKIISLAGNKLDMQIKTYVDLNILAKKLQSIENNYGFVINKAEDNKILLDFTQ